MHPAKSCVYKRNIILKVCCDKCMVQDQDITCSLNLVIKIFVFLLFFMKELIVNFPVKAH